MDYQFNRLEEEEFNSSKFNEEQFSLEYSQINIYDKIIQEEEDSDGQNINIPEKDKYDFNSTIITVVKTILGSGLLAFPYLFKTFGIFYGIVLLIIIGIVTIYSVELLLICKDITKKYGYSMYGKITLGLFGSLLVKFLIISLNFGISCMCLKIFGDSMENLMKTIITNNNSLLVKNYLYEILVSLFLFPIILKDNMAILNKISKIGIFGVIIFLSLFIYIIFIKFSSGNYKYNYQMFFTSNPNEGKIEIISCIPTIILSFAFQFNLFPIYFSIKQRNNNKMLSATKVAIFIIIFLYSFVGMFGYMIYNDNTKVLLLDNFKEDITEFYNNKSGFKVFFYIIGISSYLFSVIITIPLLFFGAKKHSYNLLLLYKKRKNYSSYLNDKEKKIIDYTLFIFIIIISISVKNIMSLFNFLGSNNISFICFILPSIFTLILFKKNRIEKGKNKAYIVLSIGIIGLMSFYINELYHKMN